MICSNFICFVIFCEISHGLTYGKGYSGVEKINLQCVTYEKKSTMGWKERSSMGLSYERV